MKKAKKFLLNLLAFASVSAFALGMVACGDDSTGDNTTPVEKTEIEQVYDSYVEYATEQGQAPLDYEVWLATIQGATGAKGDKGDKGDKGVGIENVQVDENGMMIITLTDGTVLPAIELPTGEPIEKGATRNLHYQRILGKDEYRVIGLGLASEQDIIISSTYNGLPVTEIGERAFEEVVHISSVVIPTSVTTIGMGAFSECENLTSITIPDSVTMIGEWAFFGCKNLESIAFPNTINKISSQLLDHCDSLTNIDIPNSVTIIEDVAFQYCDNLTSVTIPDSVTVIGYGTFYACDNLENITFGGTIEQWNTIEKGDNWNRSVPATKVVCSDGDVEL
ncbi:MAG: leucine-rich repeat domain-containing protein [Clostridia bacterium]|nr:leucine-rich repeat domain-containing protein [Clostridia bacterium]